MILHSVRVSYENWLDTNRFKALLDILDGYPGVVHEVALFTSSVHPPLPLDVLQQRAALMGERIRETKDRGYRCGINILSTIGHHNEDLDHVLQGNYTRMTNTEGETCAGSFCMIDPAFQREYVVPVYQALAEAKPDFIWVDDDIRYGHMPIGYGCFCDRCVERFNALHQLHHTRASLALALEEWNPDLRKNWLDFNTRKIVELLSLIQRSVTAVSPDIALGLMSGVRFYEGFDFALWADALTDHGQIKAMWRPGGGAYSDLNLEESFQKAEEIGCQIAMLPDYVEIIQSEIENFPYQQLSKSPRSTALESLLYMTAGCTGAAFNILPGESLEDMAVVTPIIRAIADTIPFAGKLASVLRGARPCGIHTGWNRHSAAVGAHGPTRFEGNQIAAAPRELFRLGLPEAFDPARADCFVLSGNAPYAMDKREILRILGRGVYMDAGAVNALNDLGYGDLVGFRVGDSHPVDCREVYAEHPLNGALAGRIRNCRQAFNAGDSIALIPSQGAEILSRAEDYHGQVLYECAMGLYKNALGGVVCAAGYYPFTLVSDSNKSLQLKRLFQALSGDTLSGYVESFYRLRFTAHQAKDGRRVWTVYNRNPDRGENIALVLQTEATSIRLTDMSMTETTLPAASLTSGYRRVVLPQINPWTFAILEEMRHA